MTRTGRRPGDAAVTREKILDAARSTFAERGYEGATLRRIADEAGVDVALIAHHFGNKEQLFVAAHELPINPSDIAGVVGGGNAGDLGERVARFALSMLAADDSPAVSMMRAAATNDAAGVMLREFIDRAMIDPVAAVIDLPDARERVALAASHLLGVLFARHIVGVPELASAPIDDLVATVGPTLQRYLTQGVQMDPDG